VGRVYVDIGIYIVPIDPVVRDGLDLKMCCKSPRYAYDVGMVISSINNTEKLLGGVSHTIVNPKLIIIGVFMSIRGVIDFGKTNLSLNSVSAYCKVYEKLPIYCPREYRGENMKTLIQMNPNMFRHLKRVNFI